MNRNKLRALKAEAYARGDKRAWKMYHDALYRPAMLSAQERAEVEAELAPDPEPKAAEPEPFEPPVTHSHRGRRHSSE